ncbi:hypothetical protein H6H01_28605 [Nostoc calcicola FACHB-3891]|nr:hypothetical protein [Nostoc calcicola FACHB-3891]MDZ8060154.1 hypothetical protein [Nostoc sp. EkiNYC01]
MFEAKLFNHPLTSIMGDRRKHLSPVREKITNFRRFSQQKIKVLPQSNQMRYKIP